MELQWPLMIFTLFVCLGAGLFAFQGVLALRGKGYKAQLPSLIVSLIAIIIGGMGSFLHLEHWERIFNGFGHLTSGITQELIGIVVFVIALLVYFIVMRRSEEGIIPRWCGIMAIVISIALVFVMGHSYNMAARPLWDTLLLPLYYLTNAAFLGSLALMALVEITKTKDSSRTLLAKASLITGAIQALATAAFIALFSMSVNAFTSVGYYFDPTHPTKAMADPAASLTGVIAGGEALLFWVGVVIIGIVLPLVIAYLVMKAKGEKNMLVVSLVALGAVLIGGMCMRVIFYLLGFSVFIFY